MEVMYGSPYRYFIYMSCVLRYRQQRSSLLLKFYPGVFGVVQCFIQNQTFRQYYRLSSTVKIECDNVRWYTLVTTVLWLKLKQ